MPEDRRQMRYRGFVLHNLLKNCVQRRSHRVLQNDLPKKLEFVILVRLSPSQIPWYRSFTKIRDNSSEEGILSTFVLYFPMNSFLRKYECCSRLRNMC